MGRWWNWTRKCCFFRVFALNRVLCCALLCFAVLCCALLCFALLCFALLDRAHTSHTSNMRPASIYLSSATMLHTINRTNTLETLRAMIRGPQLHSYSSLTNHPPSTNTELPVTNLARSDAKHTSGLAHLVNACLSTYHPLPLPLTV